MIFRIRHVSESGGIKRLYDITPGSPFRDLFATGSGITKRQRQRPGFEFQRVGTVDDCSSGQVPCLVNCSPSRVPGCGEHDHLRIHHGLSNSRDARAGANRFHKILIFLIGWRRHSKTDCVSSLDESAAESSANGTGANNGNLHNLPPCV